MSEVIIETAEATRVVLINRPESRNALTAPTLTALVAALRDASADPAIRCIVLGGAGDHFSAGADLRKAMLEDPAAAAHVESALDAFHALVAAVGFGADLAFACDLRVASTRAYAQEKFVKIGLMPDGGGTFWLPRLVGTARAMQMILLAERVDAPELHRLGVVARMVEPSALREATMAVARELAAGPPLAFAAIKRAIYASWGSIEDALRREREGQLKLLRSADVAEGVAAWAEKRAPRFEGR
jgi:enoyl-CoA hydratase/carnithine racemase